LGTAQIRFPDLNESDLIFDAEETRSILGFFWPDSSARIAAMEPTVGVRRFAQQLLIAAIDASYAMGYVEALFNALTSRKMPQNLKTLAKRFARNARKHWWKHVQMDELEDVRIYDAVRARIADLHGTRMEEYLQGLIASAGASKLQPLVVVRSPQSLTLVWV